MEEIYSRLPIGVFDSGVGGLTVVNNLLKLLPNEDIIYFADTKNFPYGTKTEDEVKSYADKVLRFLLNEKVKAVIVACNTVSSIAIPDLIDVAKPIPVFGMIQAGARYSLRSTKNKRIGVISTPLTAKKHAYKSEILRIDPHAAVFEVGSQELVNLVEDGNIENKSAFELAREKLQCPLSENIDTLILGCTHFPFLYTVVKSVVGGTVSVIDPSDYLVVQLRNYLSERNLFNSSHRIDRYFTSGDKIEFLNKTRIFLEEPPNNVERVDL
ncbi:MAG: glutamate racemase [Caldisericaceae bacterium]